MPKPKSLKTTAIAVPATRQEAEALLLKIGQLQRKVGRIEDDFNEALSRLKDGHEKLAHPHNEEIATLFEALHAWAEANRQELLQHGGKTVDLSTGQLMWRTTPPSVRLTGADEVIKNLKALGKTQFVRVKEEVNKEAILQDPQAVSAVKGISISQREEFVARPFESQLERVETVKKGGAGKGQAA